MLENGHKRKRTVPWIRSFIISLTITLFAAACAPQSAEPPANMPAPSDKPAAAAETKQPAAPAAVPAGFYRNPLPVKPIADPYVFRASNGLYYMYPTSSGVKGYKVWSSPNLVNWKDEGVAYKAAGDSWSVAAWWAPEVVERNGKYYMFYTAELAKEEKRIGVAVADKPTGPFKDAIGKPIMDFEGIDAHVFQDDDGKTYMYFSGALQLNPESGKKESFIHVVGLSEDLLSVQGEPVVLLKPQQAWETSGSMLWNEGPEMVKNGGMYYLMYSANCYCGRKYSVGYATSTSPMGPFKKYELNPIMSATTDQVSGPGHHAVVKSPDGSEYIVAYHTHVDPKAGGGKRQLQIDRMGFREDGTMYINGPTLTSQPPPQAPGGPVNIAPLAAVKTSGTLSGYNSKALVDKEIGLYPNLEKREWAASNEGAGAWVELTWPQEQTVASVLLYNSAKFERKVVKGKLELSDGTVMKDIVFGKVPGEAAIVDLQGKKLKSLKFTIELGASAKEAGLSEIVVLGTKQN
jgi:GH43 family beta-xylosidase